MCHRWGGTEMFTTFSLVSLLHCVVWAPIMLAQGTTGTISGTITDSVPRQGKLDR
jgi:hypothetical protein